MRRLLSVNPAHGLNVDRTWRKAMEEVVGRALTEISDRCALDNMARSCANQAHVASTWCSPEALPPPWPGQVLTPGSFKAQLHKSHLELLAFCSPWELQSYVMTLSSLGHKKRQHVEEEGEEEGQEEEEQGEEEDTEQEREKSKRQRHMDPARAHKLFILHGAHPCSHACACNCCSSAQQAVATAGHHMWCHRCCQLEAMERQWPGPPTQPVLKAAEATATGGWCGGARRCPCQRGTGGGGLQWHRAAAQWCRHRHRSSE